MSARRTDDLASRHFVVALELLVAMRAIEFKVAHGPRSFAKGFSGFAEESDLKFPLKLQATGRSQIPNFRFQIAGVGLIGASRRNARA